MKYFYAALSALIALSISRMSIAFARKLDAQTEAQKQSTESLCALDKEFDEDEDDDEEGKEED